MPRSTPRRLGGLPLAAAVGLLVVAACQRPGGSAGPGGNATPGTFRVVATTTVLADLARQVGGDRVSVESLVPKGGEVHTFDPTPADATRVAEAQLIVMNGLGLDDWLGNLVRNAGAAATPIVKLGEDLPGVAYLGPSGTEARPGERVNPHLWLDVANAGAYVEKLAAALEQTDPTQASAYKAGATAYARHLTDLDSWVTTQLAAIPPDHRRVVSFHEAFPYFAARYGLRIVGVVVASPGQDPSAGEVAALVDAIKAAGVRAILSEVQFSPQLAQTIAGETGVRVVSDLYTDSLGDPPVDTYEGLIRWDVGRMIEALR